ncbi:MAG: hypothetical protein AAF717_09145 [Bacteroidota bacterium]
MSKKTKEVAIGFVVGLIANTFGTLLYILLFSERSIAATFESAIAQGYFGSLLALGAVLNLIAFFGFLRLKRDFRARGVMIATLLTATIILIYKFI